MLLVFLILATTSIQAVGILSQKFLYGVSALSLNGNGYARVGVLNKEYEAGVIFRSESNEVSNGATNTNLFEYGISGSYKRSLTEKLDLTFGGVLTMFNGKDQGLSITGGTFFAPFVGLQNAITPLLLLDVAYYPFTMTSLSFSGGTIQKSTLNAVSASVTWIMPQAF